jgi:hypothetical protein
MDSTNITHDTGAKAEFQTILRLLPRVPDNSDQELEQIAERSVQVLCEEAAGLALGVVAAVDLDERAVELEMTVEASSDSELHQKMGLILGELERGVPLELSESTASRSSSQARDERELVPA